MKKSNLETEPSLIYYLSQVLVDTHLNHDLKKVVYNMEMLVFLPKDQRKGYK